MLPLYELRLISNMNVSIRRKCANACRFGLGAVLNPTIGHPASSFRSFIPTPIKYNRVMSSKTGFKQVQSRPHILALRRSFAHLYQLEGTSSVSS